LALRKVRRTSYKKVPLEKTWEVHGRDFNDEGYTGPFERTPEVQKRYEERNQGGRMLAHEQGYRYGAEDGVEPDPNNKWSNRTSKNPIHAKNGYHGRVGKKVNSMFDVDVSGFFGGHGGGGWL
jgi:hypothetical protein